MFMFVFVTTLTLMVGCTKDETLSSFEGKVVALVPPVKKSYPYLPYLYTVKTDSIKWLYDCASGNGSLVNIILKGTVKTDSLGDLGDTIPLALGENHLNLALETKTGSTPSKIKVTINADGTFFDTVRIASSPAADLILPQSSRLFVDADVFVSDTIPLINPHSSK
jgi:hypothetical protein